MNAAKVVEELKQRFPNEPEYIQAVSQVLPTIEEEYNKHPEFEKANLIESALPQVCKPRYPEVPCFRADLQELSDNPAYGWCQGWI